MSGVNIDELVRVLRGGLGVSALLADASPDLVRFRASAPRTQIQRGNKRKVVRTKLLLVQEVFCLLAMALGAIVCHPTLHTALTWSSW